MARGCEKKLFSNRVNRENIGKQGDIFIDDVIDKLMEMILQNFDLIDNFIYRVYT